MVDVGKPYYGQLQKVQGSESRNVEVTAEPAPPVNSLSIILVTSGHPTRPYQNFTILKWLVNSLFKSQ